MLKLHYRPDGEPNGGSPSGKSRRAELEDIARGLAQQLKDDKQQDKKVEEQARKESRRFPWRITILIVVLVLMVAYYFVWPPMWPTKAHPITIGYPAEWSAELEQAVVVLWGYRQAIDMYTYRNKGALPKSYEDLVTVAATLPKGCPGSGEPFEFKSTPDDKLRIEAPAPQSLGVKGLYLSSKHAPPVIIP